MYFLDLLGTFAFAVTGAFRAKRAKLAFFGVVFLGIITALGGGTARDLIINRAPLFYLTDSNYLLAAFLGSVAAFFLPGFFRKGFSFFRFIDSVGLAAFTIIGVSATYEHVFASSSWSLISFLACVLMGMVTAFVGGLIRDSLLGDIPFAFKPKSNYALSSFLGAASFYLLMFYSTGAAMAVSITLMLFMREVASEYGMFRKYAGKLRIT